MGSPKRASGGGTAASPPTVVKSRPRIYTPDQRLLLAWELRGVGSVFAPEAKYLEQWHAIDAKLAVEGDAAEIDPTVTAGHLGVPHARGECTIFPYTLDGEGHLNELFCLDCICHACNVKASECQRWLDAEHYKANANVSFWAKQREAIDQAKQDDDQGPQIFQSGVRLSEAVVDKMIHGLFRQ
ncbi:hypothetical protein T484DRAFT_1827571 [Baffinella frigidus]|nr:hypothetical protein T484DRAFT_1827571 [Cryptophyta sp. CCMP2293]